MVLTVIGRTYLIVSSSVLFGERWPQETEPFALRTGGFVLALAALVLFPGTRSRTRRPCRLPGEGRAGPPLIV